MINTKTVKYYYVLMEKHQITGKVVEARDKSSYNMAIVHIMNNDW